MTRARTAREPASGALGVHVSVVDQAAFYVILGILCARPLMSETFERVETPYVAQTGAGPTPALSMALDSLLLTASVFAIARRRRWPPSARLFAIFAALMLAATIVSSAAADNKRVAVNAAANLLITIIASASLVSLMRARWMVTILVSASLATGCTFAWKCVAQRWYELDEAREFWQEIQKSDPQTLGLAPDDPGLVNFERRLMSNEAYGYLSHPNLAGSCLMMWLLPALGAFVGRMRRRSQSGPDPPSVQFLLAAAVMIPLAAALWLTGSTGAWVGAATGVALLFLLGAAARYVAARPRRVVAVLAAAYCAVIAVVAAYGVTKGTLPHSSLAFRWHYWSAAGSAYRDAPLTGVGRENFVGAFVRHKPAESPEEVRNPHNMWLTFLVEMGPIGLIAAVMLIGMTAVAALRALRENPSPGSCADNHLPARTIIAFVATLMIHVVFARHEALRPDLIVLVWAMEIPVLWCAAMLCAIRVVRPTSDGAVDRWLAAGLLAAVFAALVHNLVGFSLFVPAGIATVGVLSASAVGLSRTGPQSAAGKEPETGSARVHAIPILIGMIMVAAHVLLITLPTARTDRAMGRMQAALSKAQSWSEAGDAVLVVERAIAADPWDARTARRVAATAHQLGSIPSVPLENRLRWLQRALSNARIATGRAPRTVENWRLTGRIQKDLAGAFGDDGRDAEQLEALRASAAAFSQAVELYPVKARIRIDAGEAWFRLWQHTQAQQDGTAALRAFEAALELDARYPPEEVVRLTGDENRSIKAHLWQLRDAGLDVRDP